jgi:hypothetical protein
MALFAASALGAVGSCLLHVQDFYDVGWKHTLWLIFFLGLRGVAFGLTPACAALLALDPRSAAVRVHPPPRTE